MTFIVCVDYQHFIRAIKHHPEIPPRIFSIEQMSWAHGFSTLKELYFKRYESEFEIMFSVFFVCISQLPSLSLQKTRTLSHHVDISVSFCNLLSNFPTPTFLVYWIPFFLFLKICVLLQ
jgi:hypothetical protein